MAKKYKREIIVAVSDTHGGHKLGLCNPETELIDVDNGEETTYFPALSETQKFMWNVYEWGIAETIKLAEDDEIVLIHNGDPTHGKAGFLQTMSTRFSDQILIAQANMDRWFQYKNVKAARFTVGTGIHELGEGSSSILIVNALNNKYPKIDIRVVYHGLLDLNGFLIDYAHHGTNIGGRSWLKGNEMRYYLRSIMMSSIMEQITPAHLFLRGHYHEYHREFLEIRANGNLYKSWITLLPGFTFKDDYTRRAMKSAYKQTVGIVAFEIINGVLHETYPFIQTVDIRTQEKL